MRVEPTAANSNQRECKDECVRFPHIMYVCPHNEQYLMSCTVHRCQSVGRRKTLMASTSIHTAALTV